MPAKFMAGTVAVPADAGAKALHLRDKLLPATALQIFVHGQLLFGAVVRPSRRDRC
jgi:hypothetical protein